MVPADSRTSKNRHRHTQRTHSQNTHTRTHSTHAHHTSHASLPHPQAGAGPSRRYSSKAGFHTYDVESTTTRIFDAVDASLTTPSLPSKFFIESLMPPWSLWSFSATSLDTPRMRTTSPALKTVAGRAYSKIAGFQRYLVPRCNKTCESEESGGCMAPREKKRGCLHFVLTNDAHVAV